ncbi:hypothetical protein SAMN04487996_107216 [Dyadobacter soli]|uniref:Uncharacterized protein n=1 Tax=Dyadobacter soli TaxID=659014 RepID=A0A1G7GDC4_9BACT|nr:hypothetical protein SAMN04487996_107216 [Dyadobacter soli]
MGDRVAGAMSDRVAGAMIDRAAGAISKSINNENDELLGKNPF